MIRTKILATVGPACSDAQTLSRLFDAGVDVCRLNFSHGTLEQHAEMLGMIRQAAARCAHPLAILGDLGGPKIRLGQIADILTTGGMPVEIGEQLVIQRGSILGQNRRVSTTYPQMVDDVRVGDRVLVEDGLLRFVCVEKTSDELRCNCTAGGVLKTAKGINLPDTPLNVPSITERDWQCVRWAIENDLDYLALSFVRRPDELHELRRFLHDASADIHLVAKIEKSEAVERIDAIINASDALMVARGDLGVEMELAQVPIIQKDLVRRCQLAGKPVIVATQMLQSMIEQPSPTRAEVSDVANAIIDGADAVMLSGETAVGRFPVGAVHTMARVAQVTEQYLCGDDAPPAPLMNSDARRLSVAVARGVWQIVRELPIKLVVVWSQRGGTARIFSKHHFPVPVLALSSDEKALRRMALYHGVLPRHGPAPRGVRSLIESIDRVVQENNLAAPGEQIILVVGASIGTPETRNSIVIHTVGDVWSATPRDVVGRGDEEAT